MVTYLNYASPFGRETVEEIEQTPGQPAKEFHKEVNRLIREYHLAGLAVYASRRPCGNWK